MIEQFVINEDGKVVIDYSLASIIRSKLIDLLRTQKGTLPMNLDYGSNLKNLVLLPVDENFPNLALAVIREAVATYLPYVFIDSVNAVEDNGKIFLTIRYFLPDSIEPELIENLEI